MLKHNNNKDKTTMIAATKTTMTMTEYTFTL